MRQSDDLGAVDFYAGARRDRSLGHEPGGDERLTPLGYGASDAERVHGGCGFLIIYWLLYCVVLPDLGIVNVDTLECARFYAEKK